MAKTVIEAEVKTNVGAVSKDISFMGISVNSVSAAFTKMAVMAKSAFASVRAGIISTGIGALVVGVVALFTYFTKTQRGADMLKKAMAGLGAVVDVLIDLFSSVGEIMVDAFKDPQAATEDLWKAIKKNLMNRIDGFIDSFKALGEVIDGVFSMDWDKVTEGAEKYGKALIQASTGLDAEQQQAMLDKAKAIADEIEREAAAAIRLEGIRQGIRRKEMAFSKVQAQTRQDIAKARLDAMDETKTQEVRLKAVEDVMKKELEMTEGLLKLQEQKVAAAAEQLGLGESMIEDEEALMALEVELINLQTQSIMSQKRLMTEVETLKLEIKAKEEADLKIKTDAEKARIAKEKIDLQALTEWNLTRIEGETDKELQIRMKAAEAADKKLTSMRKENAIAGIKDEVEGEKQRALAILQVQYDAQLEELKQHENFLQLKEELDIKYDHLREAATDAADAKQKQKDKALADYKEDLAMQAFQTVGSHLDASMDELESNYSKEKRLAEANGEDTTAIDKKYEAKRKKLAQQQKTFQVAEAMITTYRMASEAYLAGTKVPGAGLALGPIAAAVALAAGLANVRSILSQDVGAGGGGGAAAATSGTPAPEMMSGSFELGGGQEVEPLQAYVVSDDITDNQDALALIRRRATI